MMGRMGDLHVVFGAGQAGRLIAARLVELDQRVRVVSRRAHRVPGAECVTGDAADPGFCEAQAAGARSVYHCLASAYDVKAWAEELPRFAANLSAAAGRAGARLVVLDNLYALGRPHGRLIDEDLPMNPCCRKGEIRAQVAEALFAAHQRGEVRVVAGRASDFYGPGATKSHFGERFWRQVLEGRTPTLLVGLDTAHSYHLLRDVARGLAALGMAEDDVVGRAWMLPCAPAGPTRALVAQFAEALGRPLRVRSMPVAAARVLGLFVPIAREAAEVSYQWAEPFVVDDGRFRARFGLEGTPLSEGARETATWATRAYASGRRAG